MSPSETTHRLGLDEFMVFRDMVSLRGWFFDSRGRVERAEALFEGKEPLPLEWEGLPSPDVVKVHGGAASDCRFAWRFFPEGGDVLKIRLAFTLAGGERVVTDPLPAYGEGRTPYARKRRKGFLARFAERLSQAPAGARVLEIGSRARSGVTNNWLVPDQLDYTGVDIAPGENVDLVCDAHELSSHLPENSFDFVFSLNVFEHLLMPWKVAIEMNRVMKRGGQAAVLSHQTFPLHDTPWDFWRFSDRAWGALFNQATGFRVIETELNDRMCIHPQFVYVNTLPIPNQPAFAHSMVLAEKTGPTSLCWDVDAATLVQEDYPA